MYNLKNYLLFIFFFLLFYIENISFGGIKFAIIWKIVFLSYVLAYIVHYRFTHLSKFMMWGYVLSLKNLIPIYSFNYIIPAISEILKFSFIPLLTHFFNLLVINKNFNIYNFLLKLSIFIILSCIPFLLGIISPLAKGYDLSIFGLEEYGFIGIFQIAHSAAITIAFSMIVIIFELLKTDNINKKIFLLLLLFIGIWVEIQTYVRTGLAIILLSSIYLFIYKKNFLFYLKLFFPLTIIFGILLFYYQNSESFQMRINGTNKYLIESNTKTNIDSGRFKFSEVAIENWAKSDLENIFIGLGIEQGLDLMKEKVGFRIYAHNGFIDILQFNGLVGIILYLLFLIYLVIYLISRKNSKYYALSFSLFLAYLLSMFLQGERFFLADLIFALSLALIDNKEKYENN